MKIKEFRFEGYKVYYSIIGNGDQNIIGFHGYGQDIHAFNFIKSDAFLKKYSLYTVGLFYHDSVVLLQKRQPLLPENQIKLIDHLLKIESIDDFSIIAYSLGAKIALCTSPRLANKINKLLLIAPDGVTTNNWYQFATGTKIGRLLFLKFDIFFSLFSPLLSISEACGFITREEKRAFELSTQNLDKINKVRNTWLFYRKMKPANKWIEMVNSRKLDVSFVFGEHDTMIGRKPINFLTNEIDDKERIITLKEDHNLLRKKYSKIYLDLLEVN